jgi:tetratricopeptide (TPR) repeat protein
LFDWQPKRAQELWEQSAALGADFPVVYRNLAMVYTREGNQKDKARAALEKAVQYGGNAIVLSDLDKIYEEDGVSPAKRLAVMEAHQSVINRDEVIAREVNLYIFAGRPEAAIALLKTRFFRAWEGGGRFSLGDSWVNANLALGQKQMAAKQYAGALASYKAAAQVPVTLQEAAGDIGGRTAEIEYWTGYTYDAMGDAANARAAWTHAAGGAAAAAGGAGPLRSRGNIGGLAAGVRVVQASSYYQALAMERLGQAEQAKAIFNQLIDAGAKELKGTPASGASTAPAANPKTQIADAHYLVGLGQLGLNNRDKAREEFSAALEASPDHFAANSALHGLGQ